MAAASDHPEPQAAVEPPAPVIDPAAFKGGFSEANLLAYLARDFLKERSLQRATDNNSNSSHLGSAPAAAKASLTKVQKLLGTLDK